MVRLPETDDPFVLLGIEPHADQDAIRDAYARRVSEFPSETAPHERARIDAAFDRVRMVEDGAPPRTPAPGEEPLAEKLARLIDGRRFDELWVEIMRPGRIDEALRSPTLGPVVLPVLGALAWRFPQAQEVGVKFQGLVPPPEIAVLVARVAQELLVAFKFAAVRASGLMPTPEDLPPALFDLFADELIATPERDARTFEAMRPLLADPQTLVVVCDRIAARDPWLAATLLERLRHRSKLWGDRALDALPWPVREELARRAHAVRDPFRFARRVLFVIGAIFATFMYIACNATDNPRVAGIGLLGVVIAIIADQIITRADRLRYDRRIRPQFAQLIADLGIQSDCVALIGGDDKKLERHMRPYERKVRDDVGLALLAAISSLVREAERA